MNIVILSKSDVSGGAAKACFRLFSALKAAGHNVTMYVRNKLSEDSDVYEILPSSDFSAKIKRYFGNRERFRRLSALRQSYRIPWFSESFTDVDFRDMPKLRSADIINVHWTSDFVTLPDILQRYGARKIVVTLHDQAHFTGGCHYDLGCSKYETHCGNCPQAKELSLKDSTYYVQKKKIEALQKQSVTVISPSSWLAEKASQSSILRNAEIHTVANGVDVDFWKNSGKEIWRNRLNIPDNDFVVLSGAARPENYVKGGDLLPGIFQSIPNSIGERRVWKLLFGANEETETPEGVINVGNITSEQELVHLYSTADVFFTPSRYDNLPNTVLESMACSTPVVAFNIGGIPDMVFSGKNGFLSTPFDGKEMAKLIVTSLDNAFLAMKENAKSTVVEKFSLEKMRSEYERIFETLHAK